MSSTFCRLNMFLLFLELLLMVLGPAPSFCLNICKEKDKPNFSLDLLGVLHFKHHLLMITRDMIAYQVPLADMDNSYGHLILSIEGVPIEQMWPALAKNGTNLNNQWLAVKEYVFAFWHVEKVNPLIYFLTYEGHDFLCYNITGASNKCGLSIPYWQISSNDTWQFISDEWAHMFATQARNGVLYLSKWAVQWTSVGTYSSAHIHGLGHLYYTVNSKDSSKRNVTLIRSEIQPDYLITLDRDPYRKMGPAFADYSIQNLSDWTVSSTQLAPGFWHRGRIHIFDRKHVYIFADGLADKPMGYAGRFSPGEIIYSAELLTIPVDEYFVCDGEQKPKDITYPPWQVRLALPSSDGSSQQKGGISIVVWIIVGLIILAIAAAVIYWFYCRSSKYDKRSKSSRKMSRKRSSRRTAK